MTALRTWVRTVSTDTPSSPPAASAVSPSAMRCMTSRSRGESRRRARPRAEPGRAQARVDVRAAGRDDPDRLDQLARRPGLQHVAGDARVEALGQQLAVGGPV